MEHKHAAVLRAIADGVPLSEFEAHCCKWGDGEYEKLESWMRSATVNPEDWEIRRKPQYIIVNGFKVPKPLTDAEADNIPSGQYVYAPALTRDELFDCGGNKSVWSYRALRRSILHCTESAAIAHAKAMLGIDPKWEE